MKCVRCGAELKEGCLYCSMCGKEVQIVPDYNVEEEYLSRILKEETDSGTRRENSSDKNTSSKKKKRKKKIDNRIPIIIVCLILAAAIIAGISFKIYVNHKNANSYDYQVMMAEQEEFDKNHETALKYYKTALALKPEDVAVRLAMADIYMGQKKYDAAMVLYMESIQLDAANKESYAKLIQIYEEKKDYESIVKLADGITDIEILELFDSYLVAEPVISPVAETYDEYITVTLFSLEDFDIYYTIDGTDPDEENGVLYDDDGIELNESGTYIIKAACRNEKGIFSKTAEAEYIIEVTPPDYPIVSPDGGRISEETLVTITAEAGCSIYYTWDGSEPTESSEKYVTPLEIPTGNNILSVLVVNDSTKLDSGVYRTNFIYYP